MEEKFYCLKEREKSKEVLETGGKEEKNPMAMHHINYFSVFIQV